MAARTSPTTRRKAGALALLVLVTLALLLTYRAFAHPAGVADVFAGGAVLTGGSLYQAWRGWRSLAWPAADGVIVTSGVQEEHGGTRTRYRPEVEYRYDVGGRAYVGDRVHAGLGVLRPARADWAREILRGLEVGSRVPVYHDPRRPARSVLRPGYSGGALLLAVVGICLMWLAIHQGVAPAPACDPTAPNVRRDCPRPAAPASPIALRPESTRSARRVAAA